MPRKLPIQKERNIDCKEKKRQPKGMKGNEFHLPQVEGEKKNLGGNFHLPLKDRKKIECTSQLTIYPVGATEQISQLKTWSLESKFELLQAKILFKVYSIVGFHVFTFIQDGFSSFILMSWRFQIELTLCNSPSDLRLLGL